jgi:hypothetical protein
VRRRENKNCGKRVTTWERMIGQVQICNERVADSRLVSKFQRLFCAFNQDAIAIPDRLFVLVRLAVRPVTESLLGPLSSGNRRVGVLSSLSSPLGIGYLRR